MQIVGNDSLHSFPNFDWYQNDNENENEAITKETQSFEKNRFLCIKPTTTKKKPKRECNHDLSFDLSPKCQQLPILDSHKKYCKTNNSNRVSDYKTD